MQSRIQKIILLITRTGMNIQFIHYVHLFRYNLKREWIIGKCTNYGTSNIFFSFQLLRT